MITLTIYGSYFYRKRYNIYFQKAKNTYRSFKLQMKLIEIKEFRVTKIDNAFKANVHMERHGPKISHDKVNLSNLLSYRMISYYSAKLILFRNWLIS